MGQGPSSSAAMRATEHASSTADKAPADTLQDATSEQLWRLQMKAKREELRRGFRTLLEEGMHPIHVVPLASFWCTTGESTVW